jgi:hypothetical protein
MALSPVMVGLDFLGDEPVVRIAIGKEFRIVPRGNAKFLAEQILAVIAVAETIPPVEGDDDEQEPC